MCAAEEQSIDIRVCIESLPDILFDEKICAITGGFTIFYERHPHRASGLGDMHIGIKFGDLELIRVAADSAGGGEESDMSTSGYFADRLHCRAYDTEHTTVGIRDREDMLLDRAESLGGGGVTSQNHQVATTAEKFLDSLTSKIEDDIETTGAVRGSGIIAEIEVVILREDAFHLLKDGKTAITGIEYADTTWGRAHKLLVKGLSRSK